jgi:hypothetical protein
MIGFASIALDDPAKPRATMLVYLTTLRIGGIEFRPIPKLAGAQILRDVADIRPRRHENRSRHEYSRPS